MAVRHYQRSLHRLSGFLLWAILTGTLYTAELRDEESAVRLAVAQNLDLQAARHLITEAEARLRGAGRLSNPALEGEIAGGADFEGRVELGFSQRFPLTARLRLEREISRQAVERARLEVTERTWRLEAETRAAFVRWLAAREAQKMAEHHQELAEKFSNLVASQISEGRASSLESGTARLEFARLREEARLLASEEESARVALATLLGVSSLTPLTTSATLPLPTRLPEFVRSQNRPDLALAQLALDTGQSELLLARAERWEDVGIGLFVEGERYRDEPRGIVQEGLLGMRFQIPLPLWNTGNAAIQEKAAAGERLKKIQAALQLAADNALTATYREMQTHYEVARRLESDTIPLARSQVADHQAAYERGEIGLQPVFRARELLNEFETLGLNARTQYHLSHARWLTERGTSITTP